MNRRGSELSFNVIIFVAIVLLILVVLTMFILNGG